MFTVGLSGGKMQLQLSPRGTMRTKSHLARGKADSLGDVLLSRHSVENGEARPGDSRAADKKPGTDK